MSPSRSGKRPTRMGRPRLPEADRRDRHIRVMVREEDLEELADLAEERGKRVSTVAYELVREALDRIKKRKRRD